MTMVQIREKLQLLRSFGPAGDPSNCMKGAFLCVFAWRLYKVRFAKAMVELRVKTWMSDKDFLLFVAVGTVRCRLNTLEWEESSDHELLTKIEAELLRLESHEFENDAIASY